MWNAERYVTLRVWLFEGVFSELTPKSDFGFIMTTFRVLFQRNECVFCAAGIVAEVYNLRV